MVIDDGIACENEYKTDIFYEQRLTLTQFFDEASDMGRDPDVGNQVDQI